ncbi:ECF RNA polymerase sigma factor SigL [Rubripirellula lacrimiformis]|uniref:ECF RNA polymerase sigma factor SigL n=1 Tax=Rubripirellula lacrimiformis TaxID=1930273 RepID=A0A517N3G0_9BACT|nr:RNA polymerase sigma factor [Rubripirellula lacrimiformis]QDT01670.1 ECF RNA polymerase sigma factor SigL [Rubripirellula lacrimiformis]
MLQPTPRIVRSREPDSDELTVRTLFDSQESSLLRFAFSLVGQRAVAEDIVQDVFLQLHTRWDEVDAPRAWLFRCVRNRALDHLRSRHRESLGQNDFPIEDPHGPADNPETALLRTEAAGTLRMLLEELDQTDQQLVKLKYFEGLAYRDISDRTGLSVGNVGYRLHHILKGLAGKLRPLGMDDVL